MSLHTHAGELKTAAKTCCYVHGTNAVLVLLGQEIIALSTCEAKDLKETSYEMHTEMLIEAQRKREEQANVQAFLDKCKELEDSEVYSSDETGECDDVDKSGIGERSMRLEVKRQKQSAERERMQSEQQGKIKVHQAALVESRKEAIKGYMEKTVNARGSSIQGLRDLDVMPTPFTLRFSQSNDMNFADILEIEPEERERTNGPARN